MIRQIIHIDQDKCNGCGACASACHEGAIEIIDGKAVLTRDDYCDGMGDCLPNCPTGAITFTNREAFPKLDDIDYSEKLTEIITNNDIKSVTILRMEVPCCGGLEYAAKTALQKSNKFIPWQVVTFSIDGKIIEE